jgi:hypothetical protein
VPIIRFGVGAPLFFCGLLVLYRAKLGRNRTERIGFALTIIGGLCLLGPW